MLLRKSKQEALNYCIQGIAKSSLSLVGQFLASPSLFIYSRLKRSTVSLWSNYGQVQVFSIENGMFLFKLKHEVARDAILEDRVWYIANKPLFLLKWTPSMQVLKRSLSQIPIWTKILHLPSSHRILEPNLFKPHYE